MSAHLRNEPRGAGAAMAVSTVFASRSGCMGVSRVTSAMSLGASAFSFDAAEDSAMTGVAGFSAAFSSAMGRIGAVSRCVSSSG